MKAVVTIIDDNGRIIDKDKIIFPYDEHINGAKDCIATKTTIFRFGITECIDFIPSIIEADKVESQEISDINMKMWEEIFKAERGDKE